MRLLSIFILSGFILVTHSGCSKKAENTSSLTIQLDPAVFGTSAHKLAASSNTNQDGPNWGLSDPTSLSQINCFGIVVGGPEANLRSSRCTNANGIEIARFEPRAGFFKVGDKAEISVPAGNDRHIYLFGLASSNGTCDPGFDISPDVQASKYSAPFVIGKAVANLSKPEEVVDIYLTNQFTNDNKIQDCSFFSDDGDQPEDITLSFYQSKRRYWIADNDLPRTVNFSHNGVSARCSRDGGTSFGSCDTSSSIIWQEADRGQDHIIEVTHSDGSIQTKTFKPDDQFGAVVFKSCNATVSNTQTSFSPIVSVISAPNQTVCFEDGTQISDGGPTLTPGVNTHLMVRQGQTASIENTSNHTVSMPNSGASTNIISGLSVVANQAAMHAVFVSATSSALTLIVEDSTLHSKQSGNALHAYTAGPNVTIDIDNAKLIGDLNNASTLVANVNTINTTVDDSELRGHGKVIDAYTADFTIRNSIIRAQGSMGILSHTSAGASTTIESSFLYDESGKGLKLDCTGGSPTVTLDGNTFVREIQTAGILGAAIVSDGSACTNNINSNNNDNLFCNRSATVPNFSAIVGASAATVAGTFVPGSNNGGTISACGPDIP